MTTDHSFTVNQRHSLDASHRDLARARAAAINIVPTSNAPPKPWVGLSADEGSFNGIAMRFRPERSGGGPGWLEVSRGTSKEEVNEVLKNGLAK